MNKIVKTLGWSLFPRHLAKKYFYKDKWAEPEQAIVPIFLNKDTECIDVGANRGRYTALMSMFSRYVHAFEPSPGCLANLRDLCLPNASIYPYALSQSAGVAEYFFPIEDDLHVNTLGTLDRSVIASYPKIDNYSVETSTLDVLFDKPISFVKIDVEGHEMEVLAGGKKLISEQKPVFLVEAEERHRANALQTIQDFFSDFGYQGFYAWDGAILPLSSFSDDLQNPQEIDRPVSRKEMRYVNNFFFLPDTQDRKFLVEKMAVQFNDAQFDWALM
ncbi:MAG: FkbM family methyltransferase [Cyanobacteria bacterium P01_F01_bin.150]